MVSSTPTPRGYPTVLPNGNVAFVPYALPRSIELPLPLVYMLDEASRAVSALAGVGETMPNPYLLIRPFIRREAVLSSKIEGVQASLSDLLRFESLAPNVRTSPMWEVANYVKAMEHGLERLQISPRLDWPLINEMHYELLQDVRGHEAHVGSIRRQQVWIGNSQLPVDIAIQNPSYTPPPPELLGDLLADWENFANQPSVIPPLIRCAMLHHQFEAIHPYLDGNGRMGRLLIVLFLCAQGVLTEPLLYLSAYFERHRPTYYEQLAKVTKTGNWLPWLVFFLTGVSEQAHDALNRARQIRGLYDEMRVHLHEQQESGNALLLLDVLFGCPIITVSMAAEASGMSREGARGVLARFAELGVVTRAKDPDYLNLYTYTVTRLLDIVEPATA